MYQPTDHSIRIFQDQSSEGHCHGNPRKKKSKKQNTNIDYKNKPVMST